MTQAVMRSIPFILLFSTLLGLGPWAHAKGKLEVYDAIDSKAAPADLTAPLPIEMPEVRKRKHPRSKKAASAHKPLKSNRKARPAGWGKFDLVPEGQRNAIADRLQTIAELIREHGRAYDYRVHTQSELDAFLKKLTPPAPGQVQPGSGAETGDDPLPPPPPVLMPACTEGAGGKSGNC